MDPAAGANLVIDKDNRRIIDIEGLGETRLV